MEIQVREAALDDAEQLIAFVQHLAEEPGISVAIGPGEFTLTPDQEREVLAECAAADNSVFLVAEVEGRIIGTLNCRGGARRATRHAVVLGISVAREWRGQGIGKKLMAAAIAWARATGVVRRIELRVFVRNAVARHLYESFGFEVEGRCRRAVFRDGEYQDNLIMALLLSEH